MAEDQSSNYNLISSPIITKNKAISWEFFLKNYTF